MEQSEEQKMQEWIQPSCESIDSIASTNGSSLEELRFECQIKSLVKVQNIKDYFKFKKNIGSGSYGKVY